MKDQVFNKNPRTIFSTSESKIRRVLVSFVLGLLAGYPAGVALLSSITEVFHG